MSLDENNQHKADITEFIKSLQTDTPFSPQEKAEDFPFPDSFDIDAFANQNNNPLEKTLTSIKAPQNNAPVQDAKSAEEEQSSQEQEESLAFPDAVVTDSDDAFNINFHQDQKEQSIKHLEQKIAELQSRFDDANKEKSLNAYLHEDMEDDKESTKYIPNVKANDEFFQNISSTIENLKGSLENIVSSRLQYEESLIRQDQTLINRLREKTGRLKAINLALNSEVKRAKNEKLESLRRSSEQTKEILSVRMQLSKVEEKASHGDFKLSRLEQQLASANEQKLALEDEIRRIREDKLDSLRRSAEQTKEIMSLRLELSKTEEKFKQEEIQTGYLQEQLKQLTTQRATLDNEIYASRSQRQEADRKAAELERKIEDLNFNITRAREALKQEAQTAGALREKLLSSETELQRLNNEKASLLLKADEGLKHLETVKEEHERQIENLKAAQIQEIEVIKSQKMQESQAITLELRRAEDKYRQEETFVKTLQLQIESLQGDMQKLDEERSSLKGKSTDLAREIEFIKEGHAREIENLNRELASAQEKFAREETSYKNLSQQYAQLEQEKQNLNEEIKKIIAAKDEALEHNNQYRAQIESIKAEHASILQNLQDDLAKMQEKHAKDLAALAAAKEQDIAAISDNFNREKYALKTELEELKNINAAQKQEITLKFEGLKNSSDKEREAFLAQIASLKDASAKEAAKYVEEIKNIQESALKETQKFLSQIDDLKKVSALQQERHKVELELSAQRAGFKDQEIARMQSVVKENESALNSLKQHVAALDSEKVLIDNELKKAVAERYAILKDLEQKSREIDTYHQRYELEIRSLKEEKEKQVALYQAKLDSVAQRLSDEENTVIELKTKIASLEQDKAAVGSEVDNIRRESALNAKKVILQTDEILSLKTQLAKAETRFLQDSVLISQLKEQFTDTEGSRSLLDNQIKQLREENASVRKEISAREEEILSLKETLSKTEEQLKQEQSAVQHLQEHTTKLKAVNFALDREVKKAQAEKVEALHKSAEQAQEILILREKLAQAGSGMQTLDFTNGIISVRKEYEAKVEKLETELKDASALCARQVKEIQDLKTDNTRLKTAEEEKLQIETRYNTLTAKVQTLQGELEVYKNKDVDTAAFTLAKAKAAALNAQISKINREKADLKDQLVQMQQTIEALTASEKASTDAFAALKQQISGNDAVIEKLKKEIVVLTAENKDLKSAAQVSAVRQHVLEAKINEIEGENKKLSTISGVHGATASAAAAPKQQQAAPNINKAVRTVNAVAPVVKTQPAQNPAQTNPALAKTNPSLAKTNPQLAKTNPAAVNTNPAVTNPAVKVQQAAATTGAGNPAKTQPNIAAAAKTKPSAAKQQEDNALEKSILDFPETKDVVEVVDVESEEMDLSMIFDEKELSAEDTKTGRTGNSSPSMQTLKTNTIKPMTLKTGPIPSEQTTRAQIPVPSQDKGPYDEMDFTDHSAAGNFHGVTRRPIGRVPNYRESEAYSDFLKRTKSIFFRIKWSLFKE